MKAASEASEKPSAAPPAPVVPSPRPQLHHGAPNLDETAAPENQASADWSGAEPADLWWLWLAAALVAGLMIALVLSLLKPSIGTAGLMLCGVVFAAVALGGVALAQTKAHASARRTGPDSPEHAMAKIRARNFTMASFLAVVLIGCGVVLEIKGPKEGLVRSWTTEKAPPPPPPKPTIQDFLASAAVAEMVLINPTHYAVALDYDRAGRTFRVVAKHETDESAPNGGIPWGRITANGQRVVSESAELTQAVHKDHEVGDFVRGPLYGRLAALYRDYRFLPAGAAMISFYDIKAQRQRIGYLLEGDPRDPKAAGFLFCNLAPRAAEARRQLLSGSRGASLSSVDLEKLSQPPGVADLEVERVQRSQIRPSSIQSRLEDESVKNNADFMDYAVYRVVKALETQSGEPGYVRVAVADGELDTKALEQMVRNAELLNERERNKGQAIANTTSARLEKEERDADLARELSRIEERAGIQSPATSRTVAGTGIAGAIAVLADSLLSNLIAKPPSLESEHLAQVTSELQEIRDSKQRPREKAEYDNALSELLTEMKRLDSLARASARVSADIESRLIECGVPLVTRTPNQLALVQTEGARISLIRDEPAQLMGATHLVFPVIREAEDTANASSLELKLVDMAGNILWTGIGDRKPKTTSPGNPESPIPPLAGLPFMLHSGQFMLIDFKDDVVLGSAPAQADDVAGGFPIRLDEKTNELRSGAATERAKVLAMSVELGKRRKVGDYYLPKLYSVPAGYYQRLAFVEPGAIASQDQFAARDPFDLVPRIFKREHILPGKPVGTLNDVPESHKMRYLVWQIARSALPPAGRVLSVESNEATIDLGARDLPAPLTENQVLHVLRLQNNDPAQRTTLGNSIRLVDAKVHPIKGFLDQPDGDVVKPGDIAVAVPRTPPLLAVLDFDIAPTAGVSEPVIPNPRFRSPRAPGPSPAMKQAVQRWVLANKMRERLAAQLQNGLSQASVPLTPNPARASHVVRGTLSRYQHDKFATFDLEIVDQSSGVVIKRLPVTYTWNLYEYWKP